MHPLLKNTHGSTFDCTKSRYSSPAFSLSNQLKLACFKPYRETSRRRIYLPLLSSPSGMNPIGNSIFLYRNFQRSLWEYEYNVYTLGRYVMNLSDRKNQAHNIAQLTTVAYVSQWFYPQVCIPPCAHKRALCLFSLPSAWHFLLKLQILMIVFVPGGISSRSNKVQWPRVSWSAVSLTIALMNLW